MINISLLAKLTADIRPKMFTNHYKYKSCTKIFVLIHFRTPLYPVGNWVPFLEPAKVSKEEKETVREMIY